LTTTVRPRMDRQGLTKQMIAEFRVVLREMKCVGSQRLVRRGISMTHLHVMSMLERHGEMAMSRVAEALDVSPSDTTGLIDRMEERGLVERIRVPGDRRVVIVRLTAAGRRSLADVEVFRDEAIGRILKQLDGRQIARLAACLEDLRAAVAKVSQENPDLFAHHHQFHDPGAAATPHS
jgi:DNA-binding MarR family transcriptional regulator